MVRVFLRWRIYIVIEKSLDSVISILITMMIECGINTSEELRASSRGQLRVYNARNIVSKSMAIGTAFESRAIRIYAKIFILKYMPTRVDIRKRNYTSDYFANH